MELVLLTSLKLIQTEYILNFAYLFVLKRFLLLKNVCFVRSVFFFFCRRLCVCFFPYSIIAFYLFYAACYFSSTRFISTTIICSSPYDVNHLNDFRSLLYSLVFSFFFCLALAFASSLFPFCIFVTLLQVNACFFEYIPWYITFRST